jgi:hypothetical protein
VRLEAGDQQANTISHGYCRFSPIAFGMGPNRRAQERERAAARGAAEARRVEAERKAIADAQKIVAISNWIQVNNPAAPAATRMIEG